MGPQGGFCASSFAAGGVCCPLTLPCPMALPPVLPSWGRERSAHRTGRSNDQRSARCWSQGGGGPPSPAPRSFCQSPLPVCEFKS